MGLSRFVFWGIAALFLVVSGWFGIRGGKEWYAYHRLSQTAPGRLVTTEIRARGENLYVIWAHYTFAVGNNQHAGYGQVGRGYPNPWAATYAQERLGESHGVWFDPHHPEKSRLEKKIPAKPLISASLLLALACYVLILGRKCGEA